MDWRKLLQLTFITAISALALVGIGIILMFAPLFFDLAQNEAADFWVQNAPCVSFPDTIQVEQVIDQHGGELDRQWEWLAIHEINRCPGKAILDVYATAPGKFTNKFGKNFYGIPYRMNNV